ncbi:hypothetical protein D9M71_197130 [compost metagenome]
MVQCRQAFADAIGLIQGEQGAGVGDRHRVEEQGLATEADLVHRQAEMVSDQGALQIGIVEQRGQRFTGRFAPAQGDQRRVGQQHMTSVIHRQHRVGTGCQQRVQLQAPALPRKDVDHGHRLHAAHTEKRLAQLLQHLGAEGWRIDVDVRRHHLHGVQIETASTEQGQHFLGDSDAVDEGDVDAHDGPARLANRISMPGKFSIWRVSHHSWPVLRALAARSSRNAWRIGGGAVPRRVITSNGDFRRRLAGASWCISPLFTHWLAKCSGRKPT